MNYKSSGEAIELLHISRVTLKHWRDNGKIQFIKLSDMKYL